MLLRGEAHDPRYAERLETLSEGLSVERLGAYRPAELSDHPFDVAVLPSLAPESYSFVLDEAFRLKVPAIVSDLGALPERLLSP